MSRSRFSVSISPTGMRTISSGGGGGRPPVFYGIANVGKGYHNRNEVYVNGSFSPAAVAAELASNGQNIRSEVRAVLLEGINAGQANE